MKQETLLITVEDKSLSQEICDFVNGISETQARTTSRKNFDGVAIFIVIASVTIKVLPQILEFITALINKDKIQEITVKGITIKGATREDIESLLKLCLENPSSTEKPDE